MGRRKYNDDLRDLVEVGVINYDLIFRRGDFLNLKNFTLILDEREMGMAQ